MEEGEGAARYGDGELEAATEGYLLSAFGQYLVLPFASSSDHTLAGISLISDALSYLFDPVTYFFLFFPYGFISHL